MIKAKEAMKPRTLPWLGEIAKLDPSIRTIHLIEHKENAYVMVDHAGRNDLVDFYGTEQRIHDFLTLAPAVILGSSGTIHDIVGKPEVIAVMYEKVVLAYVPVEEDVIVLSLSNDAHHNVAEIAKRTHEFVESKRKAQRPS
jgi:hypothetical protein